MRASSLTLLLVSLAAATLSCQSLRQDGLKQPEALTCTEIISGGNDGAGLREALAGAKPGACVIVTDNTYKGSFEVPPGVTLTSAKNTTAVVSGDAADKPALVVQGGKGSGLCGLAIRDSLGVGVSIKGGPVTIKDVTIERAKQTGITTQCEDCGASDDKVIAFNQVRVRESAMGAWLRGGKVVWNGGQSTANGGTSLTAGVGIVAADGVQLELTNVAVEDNDNVGVIVDGRKGTTATIQDVHIAGNHERGLWAQLLDGEDTLRIRGKSTVIENNRLVGLGLYGARGVSIEDATVRGTQAGTQSLGLKTVTVGDGIGVYASSAKVKVSGVTLQANARAAALVDQANGGVFFDALDVSAPAAGYKVVVQRDQADATRVPDADRSQPSTQLEPPNAVTLAGVIENP